MVGPMIDLLIYSKLSYYYSPVSFTQRFIINSKTSADIEQVFVYNDEKPS